MNGKTYVLYHRNPVKGFCLDGLGAYYAAYTFFENKAEYIGVVYDTPFPLSDDLIEDSEIYILDFSYTREILEHVHSLANKLVVLDHHKTAKEALEGLDYAEFDMESSGCVMAWRYFNPDKYCPLLLEHIQDYDLWRFKLPYTKEIIYGLTYFFNEKINDTARIRAMSEYIDEPKKPNPNTITLNKLYDVGKIIASNYSHSQKRIVSAGDVTICDFKGYRTGFYNCNVDVSGMAEAIYNSAELHVDIAMLYSITKDKKIVFELRSKKYDNSPGVDVGSIAREMGGGGHQNAAGFTLPFLDGSFLLYELLNESNMSYRAEIAALDKFYFKNHNRLQPMAILEIANGIKPLNTAS